MGGRAEDKESEKSTSTFISPFELHNSHNQRQGETQPDRMNPSADERRFLRLLTNCPMTPTYSDSNVLTREGHRQIVDLEP
jgi:hypothetical protein